MTEISSGDQKSYRWLFTEAYMVHTASMRFNANHIAPAWWRPNLYTTHKPKNVMYVNK